MSTATASVSIDPDELLRHIGWMRRLALNLLGDESLAEDAVSETYLKALRRPPGSVDHLGGWLRATLKTTSLKILRSRRRREAYEENAGLRTPSLEAADPLEQAEATEQVVSALRRVREEYRTPLLLYYLRERSVKEIAALLQLTPSAVHTRLDRGRRELRQILAKDHRGNWAAPLMMALGWRPLPLPILTAPAASTVGLGLPVALTLAAATAAVLLVWKGYEVPTEPAVEAAEAASAAPAAAGLQPAAPSPAGGDQRIGAAPPPPPPAAGDPPRTSWPVRVVTLQGDPLIPAIGWDEYTAKLRILAGPTPFPARLTATEHTASSDVQEGRFLSRSAWPPPDGWSEWPADAIGLIESTLPTPFWVAVAIGTEVLDQAQVLPGMSEIQLSAAEATAAAVLARARIRLVDEAGQPIVRARASLTGLNDRGIGYADHADGVWQFERVVPGVLVLRAAAPGHGRIALWRQVQPGEDLDLGDLALPAETTIEGRLLDANGAPIDGCKVGIEPLNLTPDGHPFLGYAACRTEADGRFRFTGIAPGAYQVLPDGGSAVAFPVVADTGAGSVDLGAVHLPTGVQVRLEPSFLAGIGPVVTVRDTRTGLRVLARRMDTVPAELLLPAGTYQVELGDPVNGHQEIRTTFQVVDQPITVRFGD